MDLPESTGLSRFVIPQGEPIPPLSADLLNAFDEAVELEDAESDQFDD